MIDIHLDLKPLSANLKRINIGKALILEEFNHILEENLLDDLWLACQQEWLKYNRAKIIGPDYNRYTNSYIIALNHAYYFYLRKEGNFPQQTFNNLILLGIEFFIENDKENNNLNKLLEILKNLEIINNETINKLKSILLKTNSIPNNNIPNENMIKKYQVFISSTFIDLKDERQAAVEAILKKGHIPAGMELFTANDKSQWEVIKKWIDDSDIYILLLGGRYGSIDNDSGKSYTQMEYEYAFSKGKPLFSLILHDKIIDNKPTEIIKDYDLKNEKYIYFKKNVSSKMCSFPENLDQIKLEIYRSLDTIINENTNNLIGWVKGNRSLILEQSNNIPSKNELELPIINETSAEFFRYRLGKAFPGNRGVNWFKSADAVKRLNIFLKEPLMFRVHDFNEDYYNKSTPTSDPIWWFRGHSSMYIYKFKSISNTKIEINSAEIEIKKIAVNTDFDINKSFIYIETNPENQVGINNYSENEIKEDILRRGYSSEEYATINDHIITIEESVDGSALINDEIIDVEGAEHKIRYLSTYNFIICAKDSPYNSSRFEAESKQIFNDVASGKINSEELINFLKSF